MTRIHRDRLGEVGHLVLLAVLRLEGEGYAVPIRALIREAAGIDLARGSIYVTLDRLEESGFIASRFSEPTGRPGGKSRRLFRILPEGIEALKAARSAFEALADGTIVAGGG